METIIVYLCCKKMAAKNEIVFDADAVSVGDGLITAKIIKELANCSPNETRLETKLISVDYSKYCKYAGKGSLSWFNVGLLNQKIEITYNNPDHCHWVSTVLWMSGSNKQTQSMYLPLNIIAITSPSGGGACPVSKNDVFSGGGTNEQELENYTEDAVPGDSINVSWHFSDTITEEAVSAAHSYWSTDALTGGLVMAVNGNYGSVDVTYTIKIEGIYTICTSSDFVEYAVGDWVVVQRNGNIILPLQIGDFIS